MTKSLQFETIGNMIRTMKNGENHTKSDAKTLIKHKKPQRGFSLN